MTVLEARQIDKFFVNATTTQVLNQVSIEIKRGEFVSVVGKSGCGKSTLLYILSTMDTDYQGQLYLDGELITGKSATYLSQLRNEKNWICVSVSLPATRVYYIGKCDDSRAQTG